MLFPDWPPESPLIGIARLANQAPVLESKRRVEYRELPTRRFIGRCSSARMPFAYTINPYRGCEFGCKYCYARYTHEFMELRDPSSFELDIFVKQWNPAAFRAELARIPLQQPIAIGTATDPYQPAERRYSLTRRMLEVMAASGRGRVIWITTKSDLIARDIDILTRLNSNNRVHVNMTVTTLDDELARALEPYAPRPGLRLEAVSRLTAAGIPCAILCCPILPLITDSLANLTAVAGAGARAGATSMHGNVLFLKPCAAQVFFPFLEARFPHLVRRYRERFGSASFLRGPYVEHIAERVRAVRRQFGLERRGWEYDAEGLSEEDQLSLFPAASTGHQGTR